MKGMTQEHLNALCAAGEAKKNDQGFLELSEGRTLTLYVASGGATLAISRVQTLKQDGALLHAKTSKGEHYVVALVDAYAGSIDTSSTSVKKAGFI
jgi:hypothetical protein